MNEKRPVLSGRQIPEPARDRPALWPRLWRTTVMVLTYLAVEILVKAVAILQLAIIACGGTPSGWLRRRGEELSLQIHGMWLYLSCATPEAPWPFSAWPRACGEAPDETPPPEGSASA